MNFKVSKCFKGNFAFAIAIVATLVCGDLFGQDLAYHESNSPATEVQPLNSSLLLAEPFQPKQRFREKLLDKFGFLEVFQNTDDGQEKQELVKQSQRFNEHKHAIIRKIIVFTDEDNSYEIEANKDRQEQTNQDLDYRTQARIRLVKKELLFRSGDVLNPILIRDSEKRLRKGANLDDAEIVITPVAGSDEVDVMVIATQKWNLNIGANLRLDQLSGGLEVENFLGLSHSFDLDAGLRPDLDNPIDLEAEYDFHNFLGTGFDLYGVVSFEFERQIYGFEVEKKFASSYTKWAGHATSYWYRNRLNEYKPGESPWLKHNEQDFWLARAFSLPKLCRANSNLQLITSVRAFRLQYHKTAVADHQVAEYPNERFYMASLGLANRKDHVEKDVFYFGISEYLPIGANASFVGGVEYMDGLKTRFYSGALANYAVALDRIGYNFTQVSYGGFIGPNGYDQINLSINNRYFTKYVKLRKWGFRQFAYATLDLGFNRPVGYESNINKGKGIKGFDSERLKGSKKMVLNLESVFYNNRQILGFKGSGFIFADFAMLGRHNHISSIAKSNLYQGYGFGIRLNQKALGISFIELSLGFYPKTNAKDVNVYNYMFETENLKEISSNNLFKPQIVEPEF